MFDFRRSYDCGSLSSVNIGEKVTLSGWVNRRRDHGGLIFIDLRDRYGITQLLFDPKISKLAHEKASSLRNEWVISILGEVVSRGEGLTNANLSTGEIEIKVETLEILSEAKTPPFSIADESLEVNEELRLKYRYLDMRRGHLQKNLIMRHKIMLAARNYFDSEGFVEVSTPILSKSTPEGARDFLVPSRVYPGNFYALPQSPQLFKQLLMVGGMDKYFQIAPCFRDEDLRADRQPEFTQIDVEMSFNTPHAIFKVIEGLMKAVFKKCLNVDLLTPFPHLSYKECMETYGSDKPDLRYDMKLVRLDDLIKKSDFKLLVDHVKKGNSVKAICVKEGSDTSRKTIEETYTRIVSQFGVHGLSFMKKGSEGVTSSITKFFDIELLKEIEERMFLENGDMILIAAEEDSKLNPALDQLRRYIAKERNLIVKDSLKFLWVDNFPLFSIDKESGQMQSENHPFTSPHFEDLALLETDPLKVRSLSYDLVLNGYEMASGSQRIHDSKLQEKMFRLLKLTEDEIKARFGYFVEALQYGTPPHLGLAVGLDRLTMIMSGTDNIRDVIAFPKTQKGSDLMSESPSKVPPAHLKELRIHPLEEEEIIWK